MSFTNEFKEKKAKIKNLVKELKRQDIITDEFYNEILQDLEKNKIQIAVIGQMKYGKSTFINSFIFHSNYLPTSSIPMTAALSIIKYGDQEKYEVEFFSKDEFAEIETKKEFADIVQKAKTIPNKKELLGQSKKVSKYEFEEYVGADGKYTPLVKMLTISVPNEILKESIVVDTPGFNDPIESRSKRAEEHLKNADFVILFLYAQRPFDAQDRDIIINKLQYIGKSGKILFVINKADLLLDEYGTMDRVKEYIQEKLQEAIEEHIDSDNLKKILEEAEIIPISSLMALVARVKEEELYQDDNLNSYYEKFKYNYSIRDRKELEDISNIKYLEEYIAKTIKEEKAKILIEGTKTKLIGYISSEIEYINQKLRQYNLEEKITTLEEIERYQKKLEDFKNKEYKEFILPILGEAERDLRGIIDEKISNMRFEIIKTRDEGVEWINSMGMGKEEMVKKYENLLTQQNLDFKEDIKQLILNFQRDYFDYVHNSINEIFAKLRKSDFAKEFELHSYILENIKDNLLNISKDDLIKHLNYLEVDIPAVNTAWLFGDSKKAIKEELKKHLKEFSEKLYNKLDEYSVQFKQIILKAFAKEQEVGVIIKEFNKAVIEPINNALKEKENKLKLHKKEVEKVEQNIEELKKRLKRFENAKEFARKELR